jgi:hypothetical protein
MYPHIDTGGAFGRRLSFSHINYGLQTMTKSKVLVKDQYVTIADYLGLPEPFVRQVATRLKTDDRVPHGRPVAPPVTPQMLARLILGLCTTIPSKATDVERRLGSLPRQAGDGSSTAETELEFLIAEAAGFMEGQVDFSDGEILFGTDRPTVAVMLKKRDGSRTVRNYQSGRSKDGLSHWLCLPLPTIRRLAQELINE